MSGLQLTIYNVHKWKVPVMAAALHRREVPHTKH